MNKIILYIKRRLGHALLAASGCLLPASCDYLDVIPDDIPSLDHAFSNRTTAESYLYGCYSFRPPIGRINENEADPGLTAGDETWQRYLVAEGSEENATWPGSQIARGEQNAVNPILNRWHHTYAGIRQCNIFLERIWEVYDVESAERQRWIGEAKFLKAYYHYFLFKRYGPIPIMNVNLPIDASADEVQVYREPVDKVVEYISALLDEAIIDLPYPHEVLQGTQAGRADKLVALTLKAELLLFAASDLFNGNTEMASMVDNRGVSLFPQTKDPDKWKTAATACSLAIAACHENGKALYTQPDPVTVAESPVFQLQSAIRNVIGNRWNCELIWGDTEYDHGRLARVAGTRLIGLEGGTMRWLSGEWAPTLKAVEQYHSSRGVPIKYDKEWIDNGWYENRYKIRPDASSGDEKYLVEAGQRTVYLHFNREPRFYASVAFDKGVYYGAGWYKFETDRNVKYANYLNLGYAGYQAGVAYSATGYSVKKLYGLHAIQETNRVDAGVFFPFPIFRLADLYLMYAEALNEAEGPVPEVFEYVNRVRQRAGLGDLQYCWDNYTNLPGYYSNKENLREIIRQERAIELAFEGKRFWDLRRWQKITEFNVPPRGWNVTGKTPEDFYIVTNLPRIPLRFTVKDYFWPIKESELYVNRNLKQNYGW
ncbi:MAG: RagB/SusD family nutrient uptake outer membrane protein [Prevotellaceae bacterium]|jgi:hypothetical protein|nr:RagB/SusD family nutrient uptake outer membrane protein [Prevotellaceae bacterium]